MTRKEDTLYKQTEKLRETMIDQLQQICDLLQQCNDKTIWHDHLHTAMTEIQQRDFHGVDMLADSFGGMGSFSDLMLMKGNGHTMSERDERPFNRRLSKLRSSLYDSVQEVRRLRHAQLHGPR